MVEGGGYGWIELRWDHELDRWCIRASVLLLVLPSVILSVTLLNTVTGLVV